MSSDSSSYEPSDAETEATSSWSVEYYSEFSSYLSSGDGYVYLSSSDSAQENDQRPYQPSERELRLASESDSQDSTRPGYRSRSRSRNRRRNNNQNNNRNNNRRNSRNNNRRNNNRNANNNINNIQNNINNIQNNNENNNNAAPADHASPEPELILTLYNGNNL